MSRVAFAPMSDGVASAGATLPVPVFLAIWWFPLLAPLANGRTPARFPHRNSLPCNHVAIESGGIGPVDDRTRWANIMETAITLLFTNLIPAIIFVLFAGWRGRVWVRGRAPVRVVAQSSYTPNQWRSVGGRAA